jgi:hypothetical protein
VVPEVRQSGSGIVDVRLFRGCPSTFTVSVDVATATSIVVVMTEVTISVSVLPMTVVVVVVYLEAGILAMEDCFE